MTTTQEYLIESDIERYPEDVQLRFWQLLDEGKSHKWAQMCACQEAPVASNTDQAFQRERGAHMSDMKEWQRDKYVEKAKSVGINTHGKYYVGALGRPTDPMAWCSGIDDAKETCKKKNLNATGIVNHKAAKGLPPKKVDLAPDLIREHVHREVSSSPALAQKVAKSPSALSELKERVVRKHGRNAGKG